MPYRGAYSGGLSAAAATFVAPVPSAVEKSASSWYAANYATFSRFQLVGPAMLRYININIGAASGNVQMGIVSLASSGSADTMLFARVAHTGVIACPTPTGGVVRQDLGSAVTLGAGDYALFFWADNTSVTVAHGASSASRASRMSFTYTNAAGVPASGTCDASSRIIPGLTAELA